MSPDLPVFYASFPIAPGTPTDLPYHPQYIPRTNSKRAGFPTCSVRVAFDSAAASSSCAALAEAPLAMSANHRQTLVGNLNRTLLSQLPPPARPLPAALIRGRR